VLEIGSVKLVHTEDSYDVVSPSWCSLRGCA